MAERLKSSKKSSSHWWPVSNSCAPKPGPQVGSSIDSPWFTMIHHRRDSEPRWSRLTSEIESRCPTGMIQRKWWRQGCYPGWRDVSWDIPWYTDTPYLHLLTDHGSWSNFIWIIPAIETDTPPVLADVRRETRCWYSPTPRVGAPNHPRFPLTCSKSQLLAELRTVTWGTLASWQSLSWNSWGSGDGDGWWCGYGRKFTWKFRTRQIHVPGSKCLILCQHRPQKSHHSIAVHGSHFLFIWPWVPKWCASGGTSPGTATLGCGPPGSWAQTAKRLGLEATGHEWTMVVCCCVLSILLHQSPARQIRSSRKDPYLTMRTRVCFQFFQKLTATKSMSHDWLSVWCWFS